MKQIANHNSWDANVSHSNGDNGALWVSAGTSVWAAVAIGSSLSAGRPGGRPLSSRDPRSKREQEQEGDQQREDAERFRHREAEDQVGELALGGGRVAQRPREVLAEDDADADAGSAHADAGNAGTDHFRGCGVHGMLLFEVCGNVCELED